MSIALFLTGFVLFFVLVWAAIFVWLRRRLQAAAEHLVEAVRKSGEAMLRGPEPASYAGSDGPFGTVRGNGVIFLTDRSIYFALATQGGISIPLADIQAASVHDTFRGRPSAATGGRYLVIQGNDGSTTGFLVKAADQWLAAISHRIAPSRQGEGM